MIREIFKQSFGDPNRRWKHLINLFLFAILAYWILPKTGSRLQELRIMTYNIRHGLGIDRVLDLSRTSCLMDKSYPF